MLFSRSSLAVASSEGAREGGPLISMLRATLRVCVGGGGGGGEGRGGMTLVQHTANKHTGRATIREVIMQKDISRGAE